MYDGKDTAAWLVTLIHLSVDIAILYMYTHMHAEAVMQEFVKGWLNIYSRGSLKQGIWGVKPP